MRGMRSVSPFHLLVAALGLWQVLPAAAATTVYRTVDDKGVVSFSDTPPDHGVPVETVELVTPAPQPDALQQERLEEMRATTDRMAADRMAREKHRAELRRLDAEAEAATPPAPEQSPQYADDNFGYWGYPGRYPAWRPHPQRPEHPVARPPLRPVPPQLRPQPHYNEYPASLIRRHYDPKVRAAFRR